MRRRLIISLLVVLTLVILPSNVRGDYIENIFVPSEVERGKTFILSFDISYYLSGEVYATIGLCDSKHNQIKDKDGNAISVHLVKDTFFISDDLIKRDVKCRIENQPEGTYTLEIIIKESDSDYQLPELTGYSQSFKLVKGADEDSSGLCLGAYPVSLTCIVALGITIKRRY